MFVKPKPDLGSIQSYGAGADANIWNSRNGQHSIGVHGDVSQNVGQSQTDWQGLLKYTFKL